MKKWIQKIWADDRTLFAILSVIFGVLMWFGRIYSDDVGNVAISHGKSLAELGHLSWKMYLNWSSQVLAEFAILFFTSRPQFLFAVFMGATYFVLLTAFSRLFVISDRRTGNWIVAGLVTLYPLTELSTAGWITTMTTYLSSIAFGFMGLVPIRRLKDGESLRWYEGVGYGLCLIYGANHEQMLMVMLPAYSVFLAYSILKRNISRWTVLFWALCIINLVFILSSPGNQIRKAIEVRWIPAFGMLNFFDKADLGFSTTMQWFVVENHVLILLIGIILGFLIWKKFHDPIYTGFSLIPLIIVGAFHRQFSVLTERFVPFGASIAQPIDLYGLVTVANRGDVAVFVKFMVFGVFISILFVEFFLIQNCWKDFVIIWILLIPGFLSRLGIGLLPTIFASGYRTAAVMVFCLIGATLYGYFSARRVDMISDWEHRWISNVLFVSSFLAMAKFSYDVIRIGR